ncbi:MAG TPA: FkbM family methyltransferase [Vicinamibacterales bacterium]|jgi:FkbM family methyltransferase
MSFSHLRWRLRKARADRADRGGRSFTYTHRSAGRFLYHPSDWISRRMFLYGDFEGTELRFAREHSAPGALVLDVGANIGLYTVTCARAVGTDGAVIAVEPGPNTFTKLTTTCARLGLSNVELVNAAAGPVNGVGRLVTSAASHDVHQHLADARTDAATATTPVTVVRLDDLCGDRAGTVALMKMDVEGHEVGALAGAERILANGHVALVIEFLASALSAAESSSAELWTLLSRTHRCTGVITQDSSMLPPNQANVLGRGDEPFNTFWLPN